jgi:nitrate reductase NapAB chaperone NapD
MKKIMKYFLVALITLVLAKEDLLSMVKEDLLFLMTFAKEEVYEPVGKNDNVISSNNLDTLSQTIKNIDMDDVIIVWYTEHGATHQQ